MWTRLNRRSVFWALSLSVGVAGCLESSLDRGRKVFPEESRFMITSTEEDWRLVEEKIRERVDQGLQGLSMGDLVAEIGLTFVGTPYAANTLDPPGEEGLVVELKALDCVTFVETALALAGVVHSLGNDPKVELPGEEIRWSYAKRLEAIRYRGGHLAGYASRLHYFSEWIKDNARLGLVQEMFSGHPTLVGAEQVDFMTAHPDAYWQLEGDAELLGQIKEIEVALSDTERFYVPEHNVNEIEADLRNGDIVAATSSIAGLDVAHTGIVIWKDNRVHLLHAPLAGGVVQISEKPLVDRLLDLGSQDGVMIARPLN